MFEGQAIVLMHSFVGYLLDPVIWLLMGLSALAIFELGVCFSERFFALRKWQQSRNINAFESMARKRIERSDLIARLAPMLGLMGTLIPLGPGLAALGEGELSILTTAMSVAFDTTVLGLLVGICGFTTGRWRRRWYDDTLSVMEIPVLNQPQAQFINKKVA